ncbi:MAG: multicopper oxidase domain-containing protein [Leptothrix sp. (in: b-proteobacteria)]
MSRAVGAFAMLMAVGAAQAGPGFGDAYDLNNAPFVIGSYFASSPAGNRLWTKVAPDGTTVMDAVTGQPVLDPLFGAPDSYDPKNRLAYAAEVAKLYPKGYPGTGKALRKFVDPLPMIGAANAKKLADGSTDKYIPVAKPVKWVNPQGKLTNDDYYEIAVVEYREKLHSDLAGPTTLRGYVQIDQEATNGRPALAGSKAVALFYPDGSPILVAATDANGKLVSPAKMVPALAYDNPHYLGPAINATRGTPTRVKFLNLLPAGRADQVTTNGKLTVAATESGTGRRNGDIFLPVDQSIAGAGFGPDGIHTYSSNRVNIHLHGGDNPWISDGMPHSWITPAGELDPNLTYSAGAVVGKPINTLARTLGTADVNDPLLKTFTRGVSAINVPDMNDPGAGAMTYYYPNGQNARMEWYHDHSVGITRLNVYAGIAAPYFITDPTEQKLIADGKLPGADATIPLILQERIFVPDDIALQDARWDTAAWGGKADMWYPHVYETVQDPNQATNFNAVGRWHWGPWFWPSFPSAYNLPSGAYGDETLVPEAWGDTPLVNGVAYPTLSVEPKPYRLRILNASNDRSFTFNLFVADSSVTSADGRSNTEVKMVPVNSWQANVCADAAATRFDPVTGCVPQTWSTDVYGHNGGVPDAATQGPTLHQIASEGGWLPGVAPKDPTPTSFLLDKGRAAVLNVDFGSSGLMLGNAERADVVVDFTAYAGKTLLVYNDSGAPVPAADPRNEYFTGYGDNSATGGAEDTLAGYGPNTRTIMQIVVAAKATGTVTPLVPADLDTAIKGAYAATQEPPVVAQSAYNAALGTTWDDSKAFARIYTGSLKEPAFNFTPGNLKPAVYNSIVVTAQGAGYITPPTVTLSKAPAGGVDAKATASLKIDKIHVVTGGAGYRIAPTLTITSLGKGSGASATSRLKVSNVYVSTAGSGYGGGTVQPVVVTNGGSYTPGVNTVTVGNATANRYPGTGALTAVFSGTGTGAAATVQTTGTGATRRVTGITITNPGNGYTSAPTLTITGATGTVIPATFTITTARKAPTVTFSAPAVGTAATGTVAFNATTGVVTGVTITNAGGGYTAPPTVTFTGGSVTTPATATATVSSLSTVTFAKPLGKDGNGAPGRTATGYPVVNAAGGLTNIVITDGGSGYTVMPSAVLSGGTGAVVTTYGSVSEVVLDMPDPTNPSNTGGGGYDNLLTDAADPNFAATGVSQAGLTITFQSQPAVVPAKANFTSAIASAGATGKVFDITLTTQGSGYTSPPTLTVSAPVSNPILSAATTTPPAAFTSASAKTDTANGTPQGSYLVKTKAIQELFDPTYGRLNATFGVEIPYTSALTQTTIPLGYIDVPTEEFGDGETQIWKITHNGVDTHPIHFHLLNVQLINRVGWDNFIQPPELNELGWKETIKMSPLEDVIVAVRAKKPSLRQSSGTLDANGNTQFAAGSGFGLPNSVRLLDPTQPEGAMTGFTQIDPNSGMPAPMANTLQDYGWEYVWHCHILGHEENDFMRPWVFHANEAVPAAPTGLAVDKTTGVLSWTDAADTEFKYTVESAPVNGTTVGAYTPVAVLPANSTSQAVTLPAVNATASYRVTATGQAGSASAAVRFTNVSSPAAPVVNAVNRTAAPVTLNWADVAGETSYQVLRSVSGAATFVQVGNLLAANAVTFTDSTALANTAYDYQVVAANSAGSATSNTVSVTAVPVVAAPGAPGSVAATKVSNTGFLNLQAIVNVTWTVPATGGAVSSYTVARCTGATCTNFATQSTTATSPYQQTVTRGATYRYRVTAVNSGGSTVSAIVNIAP